MANEMKNYISKMDQRKELNKLNKMQEIPYKLPKGAINTYDKKVFLLI